MHADASARMARRLKSNRASAPRARLGRPKGTGFQPLDARCPLAWGFVPVSVWRGLRPMSRWLISAAKGRKIIAMGDRREPTEKAKKRQSREAAKENATRDLIVSIHVVAPIQGAKIVGTRFP